MSSTIVPAIIMTIGAVLIGAASADAALMTCSRQSGTPGHVITVSGSAPASPSSIRRLCAEAAAAVSPGKGILPDCIDVDQINTPWPKAIRIRSAWGRITLKRAFWSWHPWDGSLFRAHAKYVNTKRHVVIDMNARHAQAGAKECA
jgi:hypothetical protein